MYTQKVGLTEKIAIVEEIAQIVGSENNTTHVLVPDNKAEIIIPLQNEITFSCIGSVRSLRLSENKAYFFMPRRRGAEIPMPANTKCLILKINPIYARKIAQGLSEISNGVFTLTLDKQQLSSICKYSKTKDIYGASDMIGDVLDHVNGLYDYNYTILDSIEQIRETSGTISVKEIYSSLNVSKSKLEQHFNREVGLTPKEFCKIEKINCFINTYVEHGNISLTELTYQCGYYDQSHVIKDFKYFLNTSPKKFFEHAIF
ncbi:MAG: helix-turn-helix domain-containing protein [Ekhidna sp.]